MDPRAVKDRERKFREKEIPFGAHTVRTKTQWFSEIELRNVTGRLGVREGDKVLDAGCSDGRFLEYLCRKTPSSGLYGVDFAVSSLKALAAKGLGSYSLCGDVSSLPFRDKVFDRVASIQVIHHIPSKEGRIEALREIGRVMKDNGTMVVTVLNRKTWHDKVANGKEGPLIAVPDINVYLYDPEDIHEEAGAAGLFVVEIAAINLFPVRYLKKLRGIGVLLDVLMTRFMKKLSLEKGNYLLAVCRKK